MKIKLRLIAEIAAPNVMIARRKLDVFRESVLPSDNYGISLYEDYSEGKPEPFVPGDWESKALNPTTPKRDVCTCSCHAEGQCCEECLDQQARLRRKCD